MNTDIMKCAFAATALMIGGVATAATDIQFSHAVPAEGSELSALTDMQIGVYWTGFEDGDEFDDSIYKGVVVYNKATREEVATGFLLNAEDGDVNHFTVSLYKDVTEPGAYVVNIQEGAVKVINGEQTVTNPVVYLDYIVTGGGDTPGEYKVTFDHAVPADGSTVKSLKHFDTYWNVGNVMGGPGASVVLYNEMGEQVAKADVMYDWDDPTLFTIDFADVDSLPGGMYNLDLPAGAITDDYGNPASEPVTLRYYLEAPQQPDQPGDYKLTFNRAEPADGSTVGSLNDEIKVWWNTGGVVFNPLGHAILRNAAGEQVAESPIDYDWNDETLSKFSFAGSFPDGEYTVEIPAGALGDDNGNPASAPVTLSYTLDSSVASPVLTMLGITPKSDTTVDYNMGKSLTRINVEFLEEIELADPAATLQMTDQDGKVYESGELKVFNFKKMGDKNVLVIPFDGGDSWFSGNYTLTVPAGFVRSIDGAKANEEIAANWEYVQNKNLVQGDIKPDNTPLDFTTFNFTDENGNVVVDFLQEGVALETFPNNGTLNVGFEREQCESIVVDIRDNTLDESLRKVCTYIDDEGIYTNGERDENGVFHFTMSSNKKLELVKGHDYEIRIQAYYKYDGIPDADRIPKGEGAVSFTGLTDEFRYSDVRILGISPKAESEMTLRNRAFTITFSAPVTPFLGTVNGSMGPTVLTAVSLGQSGTDAYESIESNDEGTAWTITLSESTIKDSTSGIDCNFAFDDKDGLRIRPADDEQLRNLGIYNLGNKETAHQQIAFSCYEGCPEVVVEPGASTVTSLYSFSFTCPTAQPENLDFVGIGSQGRIDGVLRSTSGAVVATLDREDVVREWDQDINDPNAQDVRCIRVTMHLDKEITAPGRYTLDIPSSYFMTGFQFASAPSKHIEIDYVIDGDLTLDAASISDGSDQKELSIVALYVGGNAVLAPDARMVLRRAGSTREVTSAPLQTAADGSFTRVFADFCDPANGFAPYVLDPRDSNNGGMGQNYELFIESGSVMMEDGSTFLDKVIAFHTPGANETGEVKTANFTTNLPYSYMSVLNVVDGKPVQVMLQPADGWKLDTVLYNGEDVTANVAEGMLETPAVNGEGQLDVLFAFDGDIQVIDGTVGVTEINGSDYKIRLDGNCAVISGLQGSEFIQVFTVGGAIINQLDGVSGGEATVILEKGTYVITIDGRHAVKVTI